MSSKGHSRTLHKSGIVAAIQLVFFLDEFKLDRCRIHSPSHSPSRLKKKNNRKGILVRCLSLNVFEIVRTHDEFAKLLVWDFLSPPNCVYFCVSFIFVWLGNFPAGICIRQALMQTYVDSWRMMIWETDGWPIIVLEKIRCFKKCLYLWNEPCFTTNFVLPLFFIQTKTHTLTSR